MRYRITAVMVFGAGLAAFLRFNTPPNTTPLPDSTAREPRAAQDSLVLLSLNLGHGRGTASSHLSLDEQGHRDALARVAELLRREDPDVMALQEVDTNAWWSGGFDHLGTLRAALGDPAAAHGIHADGVGLQYGTALLGRDRLEQIESHRFGASGFTPRKGFTVARVQLDGRALDVISLHLDFALPVVRRAQLEELAAVLQRRSHPVVVTGDFNMEPAVLAAFIRDQQMTTRPGDVTFPYTGARLDHVLVSRELEITTLEVLPDAVSDHRAVRAEIRWRE